MYEPKQGDLVLIRGHVKCFKERIDLNVITCSRIQNSNEELLHMMLPAILNQKIYSIPAPTNEEFELARKLNSKTQNNLNLKDNSIGSGLVSFSENENFPLGWDLKNIIIYLIGSICRARFRKWPKSAT